jgi:hypothetical protein
MRLQTWRTDGPEGRVEGKDLSLREGPDAPRTARGERRAPERRDGAQRELATRYCRIDSGTKIARISTIQPSV